MVYIGLFFVVFLVFVWIMTRTAGATALPKVTMCQNGHTIEVSLAAVAGLLQAGATPGACPVVVDVCSNLEGVQATVPEGYTEADHVCTPVPPTDFCPTLPGVQAIDVDCPPVIVPTCAELQNCPVEVPPVTPGTQSGNERPKFHLSQGPNGSVGDGLCQIEYKPIKGSSKVEARYAEDGVFGNGFKTIIQSDEGHIWLHSDSGIVKIRGRHAQTDWSKAKGYSC